MIHPRGPHTQHGGGPRALGPRGAPAGLLVLLALACSGGGGEGGTGVPPSASELALSFENLRPLDPATEGSYEAWVGVPGGPLRSAGTFTLAAAGQATLPLPVSGPAVVEITVEPPGDADPGPSPQRLLRGTVSGGRAELRVEGAVTQGALPLRQEPGQFTMFTPSNNFRDGYPSFEESGIWLFNMAPRDTPQQDMWVRLTQLQAGWTYEGWMVRDYGTPQAVWLSYGKFLPDATGAVNTRDDTGWGPFSGVEDFRTAGEEEFPGDDWIANPLGFPVPGGLALPLDLREKGTGGAFRWTHVISIEPAGDRGEPVTAERPFVLLPYRDLFAANAPGDALRITLRGDGVPRGTATLR